MNTEQAIKAVPFTMGMLVNDLEEMAKSFNENTDEHVTLRTAAAYIHERENPKPLTLEELMQRDGKPVFIVCGDKEDDLNGWFIVSASIHNIETEHGIDTEYSLAVFDTENELCPDIDFYGMNEVYPVKKLHVLGWLAYDHEPKEAR